jgi:hypothetical protein
MLTGFGLSVAAYLGTKLGILESGGLNDRVIPFFVALLIVLWPTRHHRVR